jgi:hypothetical protein
MKMDIFVMPARIAGIQVRRMRPETSMSAWISSTPCWNDTIEEFTKTDNSTLEVVLEIDLSKKFAVLLDCDRGCNSLPAGAL